MARDLQSIRLLTEFELVVTAGLPKDSLARNLSALVRAGLHDMVTETLRFEIEGEPVEDIFEGPPDGTPLQPPDPRVERAVRELRKAHQGLSDTLGRLAPRSRSYRCSLPTDVPVEEGSLPADLQEGNRKHVSDSRGAEPKEIASVTRLDSYRNRRGPSPRILETAKRPPPRRTQDVEIEARSFAPYGFLKGSLCVHITKGVRVRFRSGGPALVRMEAYCAYRGPFKAEAVLVPESRIEETLSGGRHICERCAESYALRQKWAEERRLLVEAPGSRS